MARFHCCSPQRAGMYNVAQRCPQDGRIIAVAQRSAEGFIERDSMRGEVSRRPVFEVRFAVDREIRDLCIRRLFC